MSLQPCPSLFGPMDCSPPDSYVHRILKQEYWSGLPCPPPGIGPASLKSPALFPFQLSSSNLSKGYAPLSLPHSDGATIPPAFNFWSTLSCHCSLHRTEPRRGKEALGTLSAERRRLSPPLSCVEDLYCCTTKMALDVSLFFFFSIVFLSNF